VRRARGLERETPYEGGEKSPRESLARGEWEKITIWK